MRGSSLSAMAYLQRTASSLPSDAVALLGAQDRTWRASGPVAQTNVANGISLGVGLRPSGIHEEGQSVLRAHPGELWATEE